MSRMCRKQLHLENAQSAEVTKGSQLESLRLMTLRAGEALSSPKPSPNSLPNNNIASKDGLKMFQKMIAKDAS